MNVLYIHIAQIVVSIILIILVLMQQRGAEGLGSTFGGDALGSAYRTRRGLERGVFIFTIVLSVVFLILAIASVYFS